jgi:hypothetical protein
MNKITDEELMMDGFQALYKAATPSADFKELLEQCKRYIDSECKIHFTETPLSNDEMKIRGWRKDIEYTNYVLDEETYARIVESKISEHNLSGQKAEAFKNTMYLGCGPTIITN